MMRISGSKKCQIYLKCDYGDSTFLDILEPWEKEKNLIEKGNGKRGSNWLGLVILKWG